MIPIVLGSLYWSKVTGWIRPRLKQLHRPFPPEWDDKWLKLRGHRMVRIKLTKREYNMYRRRIYLARKNGFNIKWPARYYKQLYAQFKVFEGTWWMLKVDPNGYVLPGQQGLLPAGYNTEDELNEEIRKKKRGEPFTPRLQRAVIVPQFKIRLKLAEEPWRLGERPRPAWVKEQWSKLGEKELEHLSIDEKIEYLTTRRAAMGLPIPLHFGQVFMGCEFRPFVREGFPNGSVKYRYIGTDHYITWVWGIDHLGYMGEVLTMKKNKLGEYVFTKKTGPRIHHSKKKKSSKKK